jgi:hypothetical protein
MLSIEEKSLKMNIIINDEEKQNTNNSTNGGTISSGRS